MRNEIRNAIAEGYLPEDWNKQRKAESAELVQTESGYFALSCDCTEIDGEFYHNDKDEDCFFYDEYKEEFVIGNDQVFAYRGRGRQQITAAENTIYFAGEYYIDSSDNLDSYGIVIDYCGDYQWRTDCYYWQSDDEYHLEPEPDDNEDKYESILFPYHSCNRPKWKAGDAIFTVGFEIEKNELTDGIDKYSLLNNHGWVIERDGSVNGYELISPTFDLYSSQIETDISITEIRRLINVSDINGCGGHIHIGMKGKTDDEFFDMLTPWMPFIFALYHGRMNNGYCSGKRPEKLKDNKHDKYQAIAFHDNHIELRIVSAVRNVRQLQFRVDLLRLICKNLNLTFGQIIRKVVTPTDPINKLLRKNVYQEDDKFSALIERTIEIAKSYDFSIHRKTENRAIRLIKETNLQTTTN